MVGSQLPWTWIAVGALVLVVIAALGLNRRIRAQRAKEASRKAEERENVLERIEDVKSTPTMSLPPLAPPDPKEVWAQRVPNRFARRRRTPHE